MYNDLRYAIRMLRKNPGFTAVAVLSLALGIGANTAIFSMLDAVLLKMLPVKDPERLVVLAVTSPEWPGPGTAFSYRMYQNLRDRSQVFSGMFAYSSVPVSLNASGRTERVAGQLVSGNFFAVLGVNPLLGRIFSDEDNQTPSAHPVAILSHNFWKRRLASDTDLVGKTIRLNGYPFTVVGVAPVDFFGVEVGMAPDVWVPMMMAAQMMPQPELTPGHSLLSDPGNRWLNIMARLRPGISEQQALSATDLCFQEINREQLREFPDSFSNNVLERRIQLLAGSKGLSKLRRQFSQPLLILMTVVGLVLLIACANVANLLLARTSARQREMAVRLALGAGRVRLARQSLTESILLSGMGGLLGLVFSFWGIDVLSSLLPQGLTAVALELHPDLRVLGFTLGISLLTGMLFGSAPATQSTRPNLVSALKSEASTLDRGGRRLELRKVLMVSQVALSLLLLIGAGLFVGTLENLQKLDLGFNAENVLLLSMDPSSNGYGEGEVTSFYAQLLQQMGALPGVLSASLASNGLVSGETDTFSVEDNPQRAGEKRPTLVSHVDPKFFKTMGISMILGRDFQLQDHERAPKVVIINERVARDFFGNQNPIGRRVGVGHSAPDSEIIGVVRDARYLNPRQETPRTAYLPFRQFHLGSQTTITERTLLVRTTGDPKSLIAAVRHEVQALDKDLPIYNVMTLAEQVNELLVQERLIATLSSFFSLLALLLACMGLYGIMWYAVVRRTNEIGIRMALGAQQGDVLWMVLKETLLLVLIGVAIGLPAALAATRLISTMLFGLTPTDPTTISLAVLIMITLPTLAGYLPARQAARVDPMVALRYE